VSHSPIDRRQAVPDAYQAGWDALFEMLNAGGSLSGRERNCCYLNLGQTPFADVSAVSGIDFPDDGRALGIVDWDMDGKLDIWLANRTAPRVRLLRNTSRVKYRHLALRLEGTTCNRDGIGTRVTVYDAGNRRPLGIRTLRAGEGYLAQSSKWLHFGLGDAKQIGKVVVRWPDGTRQELMGLETNRRYRLVQGNPAPAPWERQGVVGPLEPTRLDRPRPSEKARIVLAARVPLPDLPHGRFDGEARDLIEDGPKLLNLWASWCEPCVRELSGLIRVQATLRDRGVDVIALSVDAAQDRPAATRLLDRLEWPFESAFASPELIEVLDVVQRSLLSRKAPMPVPTSFLIDQAGRVAVIYKGPVSPNVLLSDVTRLSHDDAQILREALPFPGRWHRVPAAGGDSELALGDAFVSAGFPEIGRQYFSRLTAAIGSVHPGKTSPAGRRLLAGSLVNLGAALAERGDYRGAIEALREALTLDPKFAKAHYNLGIALEHVGDDHEAMPHYRLALDSDPEYAEAHFNLGHASLRQGRLAEAERHFREAVRIRPMLAEAHENLGNLALRHGHLQQAAEHFGHLVQLQPDRAESHYKLGTALLQVGRKDEAIGHLERVVQLNPKMPQAHTNLAAALMSAGREEDAVPHLERAVRLEPASARSHYNLGAALGQLGRTAEALQQFQRAVELEPDYVAPLAAMAKLLVNAGTGIGSDRQRAVEVAERAAQATHYRSPDLLETLALAYAGAERMADARRTAAKAVRLATESGDRDLAERLRELLETQWMQ